MARCMVWAAALAWCAAGFAQELLPFDRSKLGKPPRFIGLALPLLQATPTGPQAKGHSVDKQGASTAGYASIAVGPGRSVSWTLPPNADGEFLVYLLVRSGHQQGYEYVHPEMTYTAALEGRPVPLEPVYEVGAVRVYQSAGSWGHDMGWVRSASKVALEPGQKLLVGCTEEYAFVSQVLLVSESAHRLTRLVGQCNRVEARMQDFVVLARRVAEVFPPTKATCDAIATRFDALLARLARLRADLDAAADKVAQGAALVPEPLVQQATALARDLARLEGESSRLLSAQLTSVAERLAAELAPLRRTRPTDFAARDCLYAVGVASRYLEAAQAMEQPAADTRTARRLASWLWRAKQFVARAAESAASDHRDGAVVEAAPPPDSPGPSPRGSLLLNGVWEMSTEGSPNRPRQKSWQPMRVPHGPWQETMGRFMALDRKWPQGQAWAWYRLRVPVPRAWAGSWLAVRFEAVFHLCEVYVNSHFVGRHVGGFEPFEFDITRFAKPGATAELLCFVHDTSYTAIDKSPRKDQPTGWMRAPNHYVVSDAWGQRFGSIWQNVSLVARPWLAVDEVLILPSFRRKTLTTKTLLRWHGPRGKLPREAALRLRQDVLLGGKVVLTLPEREASVTASTETTVPWPDPPLWGIGGKYGDPANLCTLRTRLFLGDAREPLDTRHDRFGFREFWIADGQFHLNGKRLPLQGGGTWYLQEGKIAHGHRWFLQRFVALERGMNVNIERWHRHGDVADDLFDTTDELGMLNEPEGAYWGIHGIPDILGYADFDDPVWVHNATEHYRAWVRKHFNHPSIVLWSIENETFTRAQRPPGMLDRFLAFGDAVKALDPTRPITYHGCENGRHATRNARIDIVNLHYPSNERVKGWKQRWGGRPCIDGEFQSYPPLFHKSTRDRAVAAEHLAKLQRWIEAKWAFYRQEQLSGSFYFLPYMAALCSTAKPQWMGPWGDLLPPLEKATVVKAGWAKGQASLNAMVPIAWPSLSGPGIKCERLVTGTGHRSLINWFDPKRPVATPTPVYETVRKAWQAMPPLRGETAPELIVSVTRGGKPVPGAAVLASPLDGQSAAPFGAMTDPAGTAWLVFREPGRYRVTCDGAAKDVAANASRLDVPPGFAHVPRLTLELGRPPGP